MLTVGFEPTRANTVDLKSTPLDQLGHVSKIKQNQTKWFWKQRSFP